jgi:hypothetical protein
MRQNGLDVGKGGTSQPPGIVLHAVEFTAIEKKFVICVEFKAKELKYQADQKTSTADPLTMMVSTLDAVDMPSKIFPTPTSVEETLTTNIVFPGALFVRSSKFKLKDPASPTPETTAPYVMKVYLINTAIPAYVIDLGNVFVFSSVESRYARPLSFFTREKIHSLIRIIKNPSTSSKAGPTILLHEDRQTLFEEPEYDHLVYIKL